MSVSKTYPMVRAEKTQSEPSLGFASNSIHTKSGADNLQGNGLEKSPGANQFSIRIGKPKSRSYKEELFLKNTLSISLEHPSREK